MSLYFCETYSTLPRSPDAKDKMNGSAALDIRPHRRYVVEKAAAGFPRLPP